MGILRISFYREVIFIPKFKIYQGAVTGTFSPIKLGAALWRLEMLTVSRKHNQRLAIPARLHPNIATAKRPTLRIIDAKLHRIINPCVLASFSLKAFVDTSLET